MPSQFSFIKLGEVSGGKKHLLEINRVFISYCKEFDTFMKEMGGLEEHSVYSVGSAEGGNSADSGLSTGGGRES